MNAMPLETLATAEQPPLRRVEVIADALSGLPLRVLGVFAAQDLLPPDFRFRVRGDAVRICFTLPDLDTHRGDIALARVAAVFGVRRVRELP